MSFVDVILSMLGYFWNLFLSWLWIFAVSFTSFQTIWIIIPIWLSWFFAEFFQEKEGTSFGNAISNGVVPFWVGIDWMRTITTMLISTKSAFTFLIFFKYLIAILVLIYGFLIIWFGVKGKWIIKWVGRIREVTYILIVLTPFIYGIVQPTIEFLISIIIFFPFFYILIEYIDYIIPNPVAVQKDMKGQA